MPLLLHACTADRVPPAHHATEATPAEVFIQTAARNALQYLIEPALGIQQRSLREQ